MDKSLARIFDDLNVNSEYFKYFDNSSIIDVTYFEQSNNVVINLNVDAVLPLLVYLDIRDTLCNSKVKVNIIYHVNQAIYNEELLYEYYCSFSKKYYDDFKKDDLILEYNDLDLKVSYANNGIKIILTKYQSKIEQLMRVAGFDLTYTYDINKDKSLEDKVDEDIKVNQVVIDKKKSLVLSNRNKTTAVNERTRTSIDKAQVISIDKLYDDYQGIVIEGYIFASEIIKTRQDKVILILKVTDFNDSIQVKKFENTKCSKESLLELDELINSGNYEGTWIKVYGDVKYDTYVNEHVMFAKDFKLINKTKFYRYDTSIEKRIEFHVHSKMSTMDGVSSVKEYIKQAALFGHTHLAITDLNNIQAFPEAYHAASSNGIHMIYGMQSNIVDEKIKIVETNKVSESLDDSTYVFFDLETTGLSVITDDIIEIGATKYRHGLEIDRFQTFIKIDRNIPLFIKQLTGISDDDLRKSPTLNEILPDFVSFCEDCVLVAHNASFDINFLNAACSNLSLPILDNSLIDTLQLSRIVFKDARSHSLQQVCKRCGIEYDTEVAHRADYDADVLAKAFEIMRSNIINEYHITKVSDINNLINKDFILKQRTNHCTLLVKNQEGLKALFKLVSVAHVSLFYNEPRLLKETINEHRKDILVGSGALNSELYTQARLLVREDYLNLFDFYDYIEIVPPSNLLHLLDTKEYRNLDEIIELTNYIIKCAKEKNKLIIAVGDVRYLNPEFKEYWEVYISAKGIGGKIHPLNDYRNRIKNIPNQYFKTTNEMLDEFSFLGNDLANEIVIKNTILLADKIEKVQVIKDKLYTPKIDGVDDKLRKMVYDNAYSIYGNPLPDIVSARIKKELDSIIKHGFGVIYYISSLLVQKSLNDGYIVGSRGSVGSSLVATLSNITEVNPLSPHYYCPNCSYTEFISDDKYLSGYDLPDKNCPKCNAKLKGDGQDIPFETFLGFEGNKVPDIDLNFSGDYQAKAHEFTREMFGENNVFRAGTISTVQNKTAYGYAKGYYERKLSHKLPKSTELERLASGCENVKRTTGIHPGGIIVIPDYMDVYDFTPVNFPADDLAAPWKTTHFDFHAIHDNVLKLDILGHVDPTAIRMLQDLTGIKPKDIPTNDQKVLSLFSSNDALGISDLVSYKNGAIGIPEFGTFFVRGMLNDTNPNSFADLVQISGLSHGTNVWSKNAESLIKRGICTLRDVIGCRDDIMTYLVNKGLNSSDAFKIMEDVRKGKGLKDEWVNIMLEHNVPEWYIDSCNKIEYMFPKAHAVAYVHMAIRVGWFKIYYPLEYYATYFSTRCDHFDLETMLQGVDAMREKIALFEDESYNMTKKEEGLVIMFEVCIEMYLRGFNLLIIDINKSDATKFKVDYEKQAILPAFTIIDGLGINVAESVVKARDNKDFISQEDLEARTSLNKNHIAILKKIRSLDHLSERNQLSLF